METPFAAVGQCGTSLLDWSGKIVIDATNVCHTPHSEDILQADGPSSTPRISEGGRPTQAPSALCCVTSSNYHSGQHLVPRNLLRSSTQSFGTRAEVTLTDVVMSNAVLLPRHRNFVGTPNLDVANSGGSLTTTAPQRNRLTSSSWTFPPSPSSQVHPSPHPTLEHQ